VEVEDINFYKVLICIGCMDRERVNLNCSANRSENYLKAIDELPSDAYKGLEKGVRIDITVCQGAATFIPLLGESKYCCVNIPDGAINGQLVGSRSAYRFKLGNILYEVRSNEVRTCNDGNGNFKIEE
jgi:hypothetical protein